MKKQILIIVNLLLLCGSLVAQQVPRLTFSQLDMAQINPSGHVTYTTNIVINRIVDVTNYVTVTAAPKDLTPPPPLFSGPASTIWEFLTTSSNLMVVPFATIQSDMKKFGGGVAGMYRLSDFVGTGLRLDYWGGEVWMPSLNLQLQAPLTLFGKLTVIPFGLTAIAVPISGKGYDNGSTVGIIGAGLAVRLSAKLDAVFDIEKWSSFAKQQVRVGFLYKF